MLNFKSFLAPALLGHYRDSYTRTGVLIETLIIPEPQLHPITKIFTQSNETVFDFSVPVLWPLIL
jgi:hypothetical protein